MDRIDRIEESIEYAKVRIERCDQVLRLSENPDFQAIVAKGYFEKEAIRLVGLYGSGNLSAEQLTEVQKDALRILVLLGVNTQQEQPPKKGSGRSSSRSSGRSH